MKLILKKGSYWCSTNYLPTVNYGSLYFKLNAQPFCVLLYIKVSLGPILLSSALIPGPFAPVQITAVPLRSASREVGSATRLQAAQRRPRAWMRADTDSSTASWRKTNACKEDKGFPLTECSPGCQRGCCPSRGQRWSPPCCCVLLGGKRAAERVAALRERDRISLVHYANGAVFTECCRSCSCFTEE